ncbi:MAG: hypothetical protein GF317_23435 [Candidatus Lokiarchaeota archaeon]|nr:hypothetical protein [Candidatus Lokiarchaeota archaeon]
MEVDDYVVINDISVRVLTINSGTLQFTVRSSENLTGAVTWKAKKPYFEYEKFLGEANRLLEKSNSPVYRLQKYPLIFLLLDIEQDRQQNQIQDSVINNVNIYFITQTNNSKKYAKWRLENIIKPVLIPMYENFMSELIKHENVMGINDLIPHSYIERFFIGTEDNNQNQFNDWIDAIQININSLNLVNLNPLCSS